MKPILTLADNSIKANTTAFLSLGYSPHAKVVTSGKGHTKNKKSIVLASMPACSEVAHAGRQLSSEIKLVFKSLHYSSSHFIPEPFTEMHMIS